MTEKNRIDSGYTEDIQGRVGQAPFPSPHLFEQVIHRYLKHHFQEFYDEDDLNRRSPVYLMLKRWVDWQSRSTQNKPIKMVAGFLPNQTVVWTPISADRCGEFHTLLSDSKVNSTFMTWDIAYADTLDIFIAAPDDLRKIQ